MPASATAAVFPDHWIKEGTWKNHRISWIATDHRDGERTALLIHGFGACKEHWRHNVKALTGEHQVVALDLLGFGSSDKPPSILEGEQPIPEGVRYSIDLWANQVVDFIAHQGLTGVDLIGNSIGGVVALRAAEILEERDQPAAMVVLIDCAQRAIDDKRVSEQPPFRAFSRPLLKQLVRQRWLTRSLFLSLARPGVIRRVLQLAYPTGASVDDTLVEVLHRAARSPGATESFRGFINLFNDHLAPDVLQRIQTPVKMIWGEADPWEPLSQAQQWTRYASVRELAIIPSLGHCPHDEGPEQVNPVLQRMLNPNGSPAEEPNS